MILENEYAILNVTKDQIGIKIKSAIDFNNFVTCIKQCPAGRKFDEKNKIWNISLCYDNLLSLVNIPEIEKEIIQLGHKLIPGLTIEDAKIIDFFSVTTPLKHQKKAVSFLLQYPRGYLVLGGLGVGKTAIISYLIANKFMLHKILIIAPNKVVPIWPLELKKHAGIKDFQINVGENKKKRNRLISNSNRLIVNYDSLPFDLDELKKQNYDVIIADESHNVKNITGKWGKSFLELTKDVDNVYCLTGTPRSTSHIDLFNQITAVNPFVFSRNFFYFRSKFFHQVGGFNMNVRLKTGREKKINTGRWVLDEKKREEFERRLKMISFYFPENIIELPPLTFTERFSTMPERVREHYDIIIDNIIETMEELNIYSVQTALARDSRLMQIASGFLYDQNHNVVFSDNFKAIDLADIVENEIDEEKKIIVWFHFIASMDIVSQYFDEQGIEYIKINNQTENVEKTLNEFKTGKTQILLASINIISEGQTIVEATYQIHYEHNLHWLKYQQSLKRNHRLSQLNPVFCIDMITKNSIEEKAIKILRAREEESRELLDTLKIKDLR